MFVFPVNEIKDFNYFSRDLSVKVMVGVFVFFQGLSGLNAADGSKVFKWFDAADGFRGFRFDCKRWI